ncbi:hypothetical protein PNEG_02795 [Pneumocystis murina B123]|uniref:Uncharacterized protein n=1 Tax=Pneumocystis murina (strain B123) TaxID=1069680 RepID=M7NP28_PNEMU|nr:hypothetical protein PNEG_02795 [Pneumocystis murina B123]EMR09022.1 hypothetical protein PNEG_02795 [Pneumocystis murina B123]
MKKTKSSRLKSSSDKIAGNEGDLIQKNIKIPINNHSLKKIHKKKTSLSYDSKINKSKREDIYLLKKDNPNLAPPMDLSLYNLRYSLLYEKKRIQRRSIPKYFI